MLTAEAVDSQTGSDLRFDWYQATVRVDEFSHQPEALVEVLAGDLDAVSVESGRGMNGYLNQSILRSQDGGVVGRVLHGGRNLWPNAFASGDRAVPFAACMRHRFAGHHLVTRADVAHDVQAPDAFDRLNAVCLQVADDRGLRVSQAGDWRPGSKAGRTAYFGSQKSEQFARLYEKGLEQRGRAPSQEAAERVPEDWVRLEAVFKPEKAPRRALAARAEPWEFFGFSLWTKMLGAAVLDLDVPRVERFSWARPEDAVTRDWLVKAYMNLLRRDQQTLGSWEAVGVQLGRLVERAEQARG